MRGIGDKGKPFEMVVMEGSDHRKGLDMEGAATVAQCDVKQYCDFLKPVAVLNWMVAHACLLPDAYAFLRLRCPPKVVLKVGIQTATVR